MSREWTPFGKRGITVQLFLFSLDCPSKGHGRSRNRQQKGTKSSHGTCVLCFRDLFRIAHWKPLNHYLSLNHYIPLNQKVYASWDKSCRMAHANLILCEATISQSSVWSYLVTTQVVGAQGWGETEHLHRSDNPMKSTTQKKSVAHHSNPTRQIGKLPAQLQCLQILQLETTISGWTFIFPGRVLLLLLFLLLPRKVYWKLLETLDSNDHRHKRHKGITDQWDSNLVSLI